MRCRSFCRRATLTTSILLDVNGSREWQNPLPVATKSIDKGSGTLPVADIACLNQAVFRPGLARSGRTAGKVSHRLQRFGRNRLPEGSKKGQLKQFLKQLNNILIYVLLAARFVKFMIGLWLAAAVILGVVVINALLGFILLPVAMFQDDFRRTFHGGYATRGRCRRERMPRGRRRVTPSSHMNWMSRSGRPAPLLRQIKKCQVPRILNFSARAAGLFLYPSAVAPSYRESRTGQRFTRRSPSCQVSVQDKNWSDWPALLTANSWEPLCCINRNARGAERQPGAEHATAPFNLQPGQSVAGTL